MTFRLTREQLYDLVWSEAMHRLAKQIGISDVAIAKHCRKIGVPIPKRGYWNKRQAGHGVKRTPLPERDLATVNLVTLSGTLPTELRARIKGQPGISDAADEDIELLTSRLRKRLGKVTVPRDLSNAHPIIKGLLEKDEKIRREALTQRFAWRQPYFDSPFERRRLRFLNGLFLGFAKIGGSLWLRGDTARELGVHIGNAGFRFELDKTGQLRRRGGSGASEGKGRLYLSVSANAPGVTTRWEDGDASPLESQITEVIVGMLVAGEHSHRHCLERQAAWERRQREEAERAEIRRKEEEERRERERLAAIEKAKVDELLQGAEAYRAAHNLREYIKAIKVAAGEHAGTMEFQTWYAWAFAEADKLDPIISGRAVSGVTTSLEEARVRPPDDPA